MALCLILSSCVYVSVTSQHSIKTAKDRACFCMEVFFDLSYRVLEFGYRISKIRVRLIPCMELCPQTLDSGTAARPRFQSWGVHFLGLWYYCPSPEKFFRKVRLYLVWHSLLPPPDPHQKVT